MPSIAEVKLINNVPAFLVKNAEFTDLVMGLMAAAIETNMKTSGSVPLLATIPKGGSKGAQRGALRGSIRSVKLSPGVYTVTAGTGSASDAYAAAQEAGQTRGHEIKHYSTPGTHAGWFMEAVLSVEGNSEEYIMRAKDATKI